MSCQQDFASFDSQLFAWRGRNEIRDAMAVRGRQGRHAYWRALRLTTVIVSVHCIRYAYAQPTSSPAATPFDADEFADVWLVSGWQASGKSTLARTLQHLGVDSIDLDKWSEPLIDTWRKSMGASNVVHDAELKRRTPGVTQPLDDRSVLSSGGRAARS